MKVGEICIRDNFEELCERCLSECDSLSYVMEVLGRERFCVLFVCRGAMLFTKNLSKNRRFCDGCIGKLGGIIRGGEIEVILAISSEIVQRVRTCKSVTSSPNIEQRKRVEA